MLSMYRPDRHAARALTLTTATTVLLVALLTLFGCGQQGTAKADAAKAAAADTVAQVQPAATDSSAPQPELDQAASAAVPSEPATPTAAETKPAQKATGIAAIDRAAAAGKYLLVLFYRNDDDEAKAMKKVIASAAAKLKANSITVSVADAAEKDIVAKYQVDRAPMPLTLVVAPNGAVTGGFPGRVTEEQLAGAFVGPATVACLKALQDGKFVLLCVQNATTKMNDAALKGAREFKADSRYEKTTELVSLDPSEAADAQFLGQLRIDPRTGVAVTAFIAPPGSIIATYTGATDKNTMVAALTAATSGGGG